MPLKVTIIDIDNQKDFTDPKGSLFVPGAVEDAQRLATMIRRLGSKITRYVRTMDSHNTFDISHRAFWIDQNGNHPETDVMKGLTVITPEDVETYKWNTTKTSYRARALSYLKALNATNRYPHIIWPDHCLIGSWGFTINDDVLEATLDWERKNRTWVTTVTKGSNPFTEHFSAIRAEVPDPSDLGTQVNSGLVQTIEDSDITIWVGQALNFCLANTFRDAIASFQNSEHIKKMVLLRDCTSNVPGTELEKLGDAFLKEMSAKGMQISTSTDILA